MSKASTPPLAPVVVMGVSGAGKTTIGATLAHRLGAEFLEGDQFHPPENVEKMRQGHPLDDADRWPWLDRIAEEMALRAEAGKPVVVTCSALKRSYRDRLRRRCPALRLVYLRGDQALIEARLKERRHHFMPSSLLRSQFAALEEPDAAEHAISVAVDGDPAAILATIENSLGETSTQ